MDALHFLFYLAMGVGVQYVTPQLPVIGPVIVSAGWKAYRGDYHSTQELKQETQVVLAGAALGRCW